MAIYLIRRLVQSLLFVLLAGLFVYTTFVWFMPDPFSPGPGTRYTRLKEFRDQTGTEPADFDSSTPIEDLAKAYKVDRPWPVSYLAWLFDPNDTETVGYDITGNLAHTPKGLDVDIFGVRIRGSGILTWDLGTSEQFASDTPIRDIISGRWKATLVLIVTSVGLALLVGLPLGIYGAVRRRGGVDHMLTFFTLGGLSIPPFVLGLLFIIFLAVLPKSLRDQGWTWLPWLPPGGLGDPTNFWDGVRHVILPATTLAIPQIAWLSRYTRFAMLDVLHQDYIRTAWAKGVGFRRVILKHALRNTLIPVITQLALVLPALMSAAIAVEMAFAYEGLGKVFYRAIGGCLATGSSFNLDPPPCPPRGYVAIDYPLAMSLLIIFIALVSVSTLVADVLYVVADPRITYTTDTKHA